jgi:hypothetical protein
MVVVQDFAAIFISIVFCGVIHLMMGRKLRLLQVVIPYS